jgi:hypothetical protein
MADVTPVDNEYRNLDFTATVEDTYEVLLTYSKNGCTKTAVKFVTIEPCCDLMAVTITGEETLCENLTAVPSGGQAPYTYLWTGPGINQTTAEVDLSTVGSGVTVTLTYTVTDDNTCEVTGTVSYTGCTCTDALNLIPNSVDGTLDDALNPATGATAPNGGAFQGGLSGTGWTVSPSGTTIDTWLAPISGHFLQYAEGLIASPQGGVFAAGLATGDYAEGMQTTLTTVIGQTYVVKFYQANAGNTQTVIGQEGKWKVFFGNQNTLSPAEEFLGLGDQVWTEVTVSFVANATSTVLKFVPDVVAPATLTYMAIDDIRVYHDTGSNPCV